MEDGATLEELGADLRHFEERVRQIESRAMEKLRSALVDADPRMASYALKWTILLPMGRRQQIVYSEIILTLSPGATVAPVGRALISLNRSSFAVGTHHARSERGDVIARLRR